MSGAKKIMVDQGAWQRAQRAAARLQDVNRELPGMLEAARQDTQAQVEQAAAQLRLRQDQFERSLADLSEQTKQLEAQTSRRIQQKTALVWGQLQESLTQARGETRRALDEQEERFRQDLARERRDRERDVQMLRDGLAAAGEHRDQAVAAAAAVVADARLLHDAIDAGLPHERFAPGRLAELGNRLALAQGNVTDGRGEAALAQAQDLYLQLSELRVRIELAEQDWQAARITAVSAVTLLQEKINFSASLEAIDEQGSRIEGATLDVDFWSEGGLAALHADAAALADRVAAQDGSLTVASLHDVVERDIPALGERLDEVVDRARARQFASQLRVNLAELVVDALEDLTDYEWEDGQAIYASGDQRRAFYSKLRHVDESEIVVEVAPGETGDSCTLRILSYDAGIPDVEERVRRADAIAATLRDRGLQVGAPTADGDPPAALADFARLRLPEPRAPEQGSAQRGQARQSRQASADGGTATAQERD
jgi:hypothetical protein